MKELEQKLWIMLFLII